MLCLPRCHHVAAYPRRIMCIYASTSVCLSVCIQNKHYTYFTCARATAASFFLASVISEYLSTSSFHRLAPSPATYDRTAAKTDPPSMPSSVTRFGAKRTRFRYSVFCKRERESLTVGNIQCMHSPIVLRGRCARFAMLCAHVFLSPDQFLDQEVAASQIACV